VNGIKNVAGVVGDAVKGIAEKVTSGIRDALGIHSPSRVTMQLGEYTGEGFALGIGKTIADVRQRAAEMAAAVSGVMADMSAPSVQMAGGAAGGGVINMEGLFAGATINVRSDEDIRKLAREIYALARSASRGSV